MYGLLFIRNEASKSNGTLKQDNGTRLNALRNVPNNGSRKQNLAILLENLIFANILHRSWIMIVNPYFVESFRGHPDWGN